MIRQSEQIADLAAALAQAQGEIENVAKDSENPHFRSKYADLASVLSEVRPKLAKHGISVLQMPVNGDGGQVAVVTRLLHSSGQYIESELAIAPAKADAQGAGSAITYLRRYCLMAAAGIAPEDDDGEEAVGRGAGRPPLRPQIVTPPPPQPPAGVTTQRVSTESAAATAARQRVRMLIDQYQQRILKAPHAHALENVATDGAAELEEIEASGTAGAAAAKELRRKFEVRMREFQDGSGSA
jgi:hypothetical protein